MAQIHLPAGPSVPKPALSPAQGPVDTHAHPMAPKTTRPQPASTQPDLAGRQRTLLPNTIPPPLSPHRGGNGPLNRAFLGPPTPQWGMKSMHARLPSHIPGTARLSPRHVRRGTAPPVAFAGTMGVTLARSLSRASVAFHQTPRPTRSTRPGLAITPPPPHPSPVLPLRLETNRNSPGRRSRPTALPQGP